MLFSVTWIFQIINNNIMQILQNLLNTIFINSPQHNNDNIANVVLALPLEVYKINEDYNFKIHTSKTHWYLISYLLAPSGANKEENCKYMALQSWY